MQESPFCDQWQWWMEQIASVTLSSLQVLIVVMVVLIDKASYHIFLKNVFETGMHVGTLIFCRRRISMWRHSWWIAVLLCPLWQSWRMPGTLTAPMGGDGRAWSTSTLLSITWVSWHAPHQLNKQISNRHLLFTLWCYVYHAAIIANTYGWMILLCSHYLLTSTVFTLIGTSTIISALLYRKKNHFTLLNISSYVSRILISWVKFHDATSKSATFTFKMMEWIKFMKFVGCIESKTDHFTSNVCANMIEHVNKKECS